jgi:23S rRNA pseudouridine2457 synthase
LKYILFHKPYDVLSSFTDEDGSGRDASSVPRRGVEGKGPSARGRATLKAYIAVPGIYAAGRLDRDSEGLLLLSDDGELLHRLTHPHYDHPKTYYVQVEGVITREAAGELRRGIVIKGLKTKRTEVELIEPPDFPPRSKPVRDYHPTSWIRIVLREGKKRQIRHMTAAVGYPTLRLVRVGIGPLSLGNLKPGEWRHLSEREVAQLRSSLEAPAALHHRTYTTQKRLS